MYNKERRIQKSKCEKKGSEREESREKSPSISPGPSQQ
jgi:hypothetical protein